MAERSIAERRNAAGERSLALLRSIVPKSEWRYTITRNKLGRIVKQIPISLEFVGQGGSLYRINFSRTSENIEIIEPSRQTYGGRRVNGLCGGPYLHNEYRAPGDGYPRIHNGLWEDARREAREQGDYPMVLPDWDVFLGQYLALKYDEQAFLNVANAW